MQHRVRFHPAAVEDAEGGAAWYARRSPRTAERFLDELDRVIDVIAADPDRFPELIVGVRRALFHRFPYYVVFRVTEGNVEVLAIAHGKRRPRFWESRVSG
jgi:plasmid stabilization system protein ParE